MPHTASLQANLVHYQMVMKLEGLNHTEMRLEEGLIHTEMRLEDLNHTEMKLQVLCQMAMKQAFHQALEPSAEYVVELVPDVRLACE